jgi:hypothetical protein
MTNYAPGTSVLVDDWRNDDGLTRRAVVVHRMSACPGCGSERYHCRIVENDEDVAVCVPHMRRPN